jgi:4-hydroxythreonine-4-phosphate dehydrogenase
MRPLAVSMGDPAGVGLEIAARTWLERTTQTPPFYVVGDGDALARAAERAGLRIRIETVAPSEALNTFARALPVVHRALPTAETPGAPTPDNAPAIIGAIEDAVADVRAGAADAIVTLPIAKGVLYDAGFRHPGHTEFVAVLCADMSWPMTRGPVMMLATEGLRVALATVHVPLADVPQRLTTTGLVQTARVVLEALLHDFGVASPRLSIAGLNPHAGEGGALGGEEASIIAPAVAVLRAEGFDVSGPHPADTLFHAEARARYDAVIAMYHDQGLIPLKTLDFWGAANITLGLPIVRTSPDHGTGFDIAGRGLARIESFIAALRTAAQIAANRRA